MKKDVDVLLDTLDSALRKLKKGMDTGPGDETVVLTASEATVVYRLLTEHLGVELK